MISFSMRYDILIIIVGLYASSLLLYYTEGCTGLARVASTAIEKPVAGAALQSALNLFSRVGVFLQMPIIGYALDKKILIDNRGVLGLAIIIGIASGIILSYSTRQRIIKHFLIVSNSIATSGSMFNWANIEYNHNAILKSTNLKLSRSTKISALSYIFLFSTWPIILITQQVLIEFSALLISSAAILNGISTILHTMYIEPMVAKKSDNLSEAESMYSEIMTGRIIAITTVGLTVSSFIILQNYY